MPDEKRAALKREFLRIHPPAGGVDPVSPEPDANNEKLIAAVNAGVTAGLKTALPEALKPLVDEISGGRIQRTVEQPVRVAAIADVNEEEILEAIEANDKPKAARLMRQQRAADSQRREQEIARITQVGGAAFGSVAKMAADRLPHYKGKFKKIIDEQIEKFHAANPGLMLTGEHYKAAHDLVVGENIDEILSGDREEVLRKAREPDPALIPDGGRGGSMEAPAKEATALKEVLAGDWNKEFRVKQRAVGGR